jgi:bloom syndrome protein
MCLQPHSTSHDCETARSYRILEKARQKAFKKDGYNSESTRCCLVELFRERFDGGEPRPWQLDITEAIILGLDSLVIAGTGAGKTIPFMMPLMLDPMKKALVISLLKILQADQVAFNLSSIYHGSDFLQGSPV